MQFKFEFGLFDNRHMQVQVINGDYTNLVSPNSDNVGTVDFDIELPTCVILKFSGKNSKTDTSVDAEGNIISDMYVKINSISMDGFELNNVFLHQKIKLLTESGSEIQAPYIGFNGTVTIEMSESCVFFQYLSMNS